MYGKAEPVFFTGAVLVLVFICVSLAYTGQLERQSFKAFYCAGRAVDARANPYRVEPLRSCEHRVSPDPLPASFVEPAPLPGYAILPFAVLATLPSRAAAIVYALVLACATVLTATGVASLARMPRVAVLAACAPLALLNVAFGETAPLATLALALAAVALTRERWYLAGATTVLALIQPNVALPAVIAVFLFAARTRAAVAITAAALALTTIVVPGLSTSIEYLRDVLPAMFRAELVASDQFSFARVLFELGVPVAACATIARLAFAVMLVGSIAVARVIAGRHARPDALVLVPPAVALLGSLYVHDLQVIAALPAAFVIAYLLRRSSYRFVAGAALLLLVPVWTQSLGRAAAALDAIAGTAGSFCVSRGEFVRRIAASALGGLAIVACIAVLQRVEPPIRTPANVSAQIAAPNSPAANAWGAYLRANPSRTQSRYVMQLPTWLGLVLLTLASLRLTRGRTRHASSAARAAPVP